MRSIAFCITTQHDHGFLVVAAVVCLIAGLAAANLLSRSLVARGRARLAWQAAGGVALGSGVWATHFIAMLGYLPAARANYALPETLGSLLVANIGVSFALAVATLGRPGRARHAAGGALLAATIAAMHFLGMAGLRVPFLKLWDWQLVCLAIAGCAAFCVLAFLLIPGLARLPARLAMAGLLALGVVAGHFIAMAALTLLPDVVDSVVPLSIAPDTMAAGIAAVTLLIIGPPLAGSFLDRRLADQAARQAARFRMLADASFEGLVFHRDGVVLDVNVAFCRMLGRPAEAVSGGRLAGLFGGDAVLPMPSDPLAPAPVELALMLPDGGSLPLEAIARRIEHGGAPAEVMVLRDLRERRAAEDRITHIAHHDALTGLPNRGLFIDRLQHAIAQVRRDLTESIAVLCLDLDRFKAINDVVGHAAGDALLCEVANRLRATLRESDTVARLGGDEFAIIQAGEAQPAAAAALAQRLIEAICAGMDYRGQELGVGVSIGIALFPNDGTTAEALLHNADTAMYRAKEQLEGAARFFEPAMDQAQRERRQIELELRQAIADARLALHYQPLLTRGRRLAGYEALVRWPHAVRGLVPPGEFIPIAEESGLIVPLGAWVLRAACLEAARWPEQLTVAVNVSPVQFRQGDLPRVVAGALAESGLDPARLELEITEGVLVDNTEQALITLRRLKAQGVRISLDDFGTGYSSLSYLSRFPFDKVKIDQSFVRQMLDDSSALAIVQAIIQLCQSLQLKVTAEGVETEAQLATLAAAHCDQVQGYLLGRPMAAADLVFTPELLAAE
jgi:diguanylate cyclase (GGDEF)-like protein